jgi:hypothetical protein
VTISVFDINGKLTERILDNKFLSGGTYEINFSASRLGSGVYYYRIDASSTVGSIKFTDTKKMIVLK